MSNSKPELPTGAGEAGIHNIINELQEFCIENGLPSPQYKIVQSTGPDHNPVFVYECKVSNVIRLANGSTKKEAKHFSAQKVFAALQEEKQSFELNVCSLDEITKNEADRMNGIVRAYRDVTKSELKTLPGTSIFNRNNYFNELEQERVLLARKILMEDLRPIDKVQQVFIALGLKYEISSINSKKYGKKAFWELIGCDFDACLAAPYDEIYEKVVDFMKPMLNIVD